MSIVERLAELTIEKKSIEAWLDGLYENTRFVFDDTSELLAISKKIEAVLYGEDGCEDDEWISMLNVRYILERFVSTQGHVMKLMHQMVVRKSESNAVIFETLEDLTRLVPPGTNGMYVFGSALLSIVNGTCFSDIDLAWFNPTFESIMNLANTLMKNGIGSYWSGIRSNILNINAIKNDHFRNPMKMQIVIVHSKTEGIFDLLDNSDMDVTCMCAALPLTSYFIQSGVISALTIHMHPRAELSMHFHDLKVNCNRHAWSSLRKDRIEVYQERGIQCTDTARSLHTCDRKTHLTHSMGHRRIPWVPVQSTIELAFGYKGSNHDGLAGYQIVRLDDCKLIECEHDANMLQIKCRDIAWTAHKFDVHVMRECSSGTPCMTIARVLYSTQNMSVFNVDVFHFGSSK